MTEARIPPQALDVERQILGAMLIDEEALPKIITLLDESDFYDKRNSTLFSILIKLFSEMKPTDSISVLNEIRKTNKDLIGEYAVYISELTGAVSTSAGIEYHARIVKEKSIKRVGIGLGTTLSTRCYNDEEDALEIVGDIHTKIIKMQEPLFKNKPRSIADVLQDTQDFIFSDNKTGLLGIPSGLTNLDNITLGWRNKNLILVAARPSEGKTALALQFATECVEQNKAVGFFSMEQSLEELTLRLISNIAMVDSYKLQTQNQKYMNQTDAQNINSAIKKINSYKDLFRVDDTSGMTITEVISKARMLKSQYDIKMLIIDYLQLIRPHKGFDRHDLFITFVAETLKGLSKDLSIPIIALSQMNRAVEGRVNKEPILSDLRDSGGLEQAADVVLFIYHKFSEEELKRDFNDRQIESSSLIVRKFRNGKTGSAQVKFIKEFVAFKDLHNIGQIPVPPPQKQKYETPF